MFYQLNRPVYRHQSFIPRPQRPVKAVEDQANDFLDLYAETQRLAKAQVHPNAPEQTGMYRNAQGDVFRVQRAKTSGKLYAKRLVPGNGFGDYEAGAIFGLTADMLMSLEQCQEYGKGCGVCCKCGKALCDPKSVERGMGPDSYKSLKAEMERQAA